ncbi:MAG TPA: DUF4412 domain-containing protein [Bacteroidia bacterium]|nr:DUF4412 domain-containing protein [Bacteroidia bacterium]
MKKITQTALVLFLLLSGSRYSSAQESSRLLPQGKVVFEVSYPNSKLDQQTMAMMPTESVLYFKGNLSRMELNLGMGSTVVITDHKLGESTMLMEMLGNKTAVRSTRLDAAAERATGDKPTVEFKPDTKSIAGYTCKHAVVSSKGRDSNNSTYDVWYTTEMMARNSFQSEIEGIDGFMMEFQTEQNGVEMKMTVKNVIEVTVDDSKFITPEGYTEMTKEQLRQLYGGGK